MSVTRLQAELDARREFVARLEQERTDLQIEVDAFRQAYLARLGAAQAELESLELHVAEYRLRNELIRLRGSALDAAKLEAEVDWQLRGRREQFAGYRESVRQAAGAAPAARPPADPATQRDLKSLYHDLAKRAHPDLALDEADRAARGARMVAINAAYARLDRAALKAIAAQLDGLAGDPLPVSAGQLRAEIERLDGVIAAMRAEMAELNQSDWMAMKLDAALARSRRIDWFDRAQRQIEARVAERREELDGLIAVFMGLVRQAGLD